MRALIAIPAVKEEELMRVVCGVPLLVRVIKSAQRAGVEMVMILWPSSVPIRIWHECQLGGCAVIVSPKPFDPASPADWDEIQPLLDAPILWMPWNWVTHKRALMGLRGPADWSVPGMLGEQAGRPPEGVAVTSKTTSAAAERFLAATSGKPLDGIYSTFNRKLCRPTVRLLSNIGITPNAVTLAGLGVAIGAAWMFSLGYYTAYVAGAILFFLSGLCDEIDGMLARITFRESAFGTWFEGFVDNATYLLVFGGMTIGLYRQSGTQELLCGLALIIGCILSVIVINLQRRRSTDPARPNEYLGKMYGLLDGDSSNLISKVTRHIHVFLKKAVAVHYLLLFTVLGGLPLFLRLAAFGSNLTWILTIYFSRRFFRRPSVNTI